MEKRFKYRFKTEKEFINEFGNNWRSSIGFNTMGDMDYLIGTEIKMDEITDIEDKDIMSGFILHGNWYIGRKMIVKYIVPPQYKPKVFIY